MTGIRKWLFLTERGEKELRKGIVACFITNLSLLLAVGITGGVIQEMLKPLTGAELSYPVLWALFGCGCLAAGIHFWCVRNEYRKTYLTCYTSASESRMRIAGMIRTFPMSVFQEKSLAEYTTNMMSDCESIEHSLSHIIPPLFANIVSSTIICVGVILFDWRMGLAIFVTLPAAFLIILISRGLQQKGSRRQTRAKLNASREEQEYLDGMKVIRAMEQGESLKKLDSSLREWKNASIGMELGTGVIISAAQFVLQAGIGITVYVGVNLLTKGQIEVVPLLLCFVIVCRIYGPILSILTLLPMLFHTLTATERMRALQNVQIQQGEDEVILTHHDIDFSNVSFAYQGENVLEDVTLHIPEGKITAFVGASGCGKSTILRLIGRFFDVEYGKIELGNVDIQKILPERLMKEMTFVFQDVILFSDTIWNNIKMGNQNATDEEIIAAARAAHVEEIVQALPDGYQTVLTENGSSLSGGERQRISIARALLKDAPIVILDEATSSLDPENEMLVQQALNKLTAGKTVIVVAHKLKTIQNAHQIIVLDQKGIAEQGTHQTLMQLQGIYYRLYRMQEMSNSYIIS